MAKTELSTQIQISLIVNNWWRRFGDNTSNTDIPRIIEKYSYRKNVFRECDIEIYRLSYIRFKALAIGDCNVGKTSFISRFTDNIYTQEYLPTIGIDQWLAHRRINDTIRHIQILETSGDERFGDIITHYLKSNHVILILFDITNEDSFSNINKIWLPMIKQNANPSVEKILIGTKCDLENERKISIKTASELASSIGCEKYYEVSAKDNINIESCFQQIMQLLNDLTMATHPNFPLR